MKTKNTLISIVGPTAVGKTDISIKLAKLFKTVIISADSRQCYREMEIGTAKPSRQALEEVQHYFINSLSIHDIYSVGDYVRDMLIHLENIYNEKDVVILAGGSGLYVNALTQGINDMPAIDHDIRAFVQKKIEETNLRQLQEEVYQIDPEWMKIGDYENPRRLARVLEVWYSEKKPMSYFQNKPLKKRPFNVVSVFLNREIDNLYKIINYRVDQMVENGLFDEVEQVLPFRDKLPLQTVGYKEIFPVFDGQYDRDEAVNLLKRNTRRYAKRQMTWFKKSTHDLTIQLDTNPNPTDMILDLLASRDH